MYLLIHTAGNQGMVALGSEDGVAATEVLPPRGTSEHLMPAVRRLLSSLGLKVGDLSGIGVVHGPGSFTGVRVGLSAAKGLCEGSALRMVALSRLALVASQLPQASADVLALLDAGRSEFYCGLYRSGVMVAETLETREGVSRLLMAADAVTCDPPVADSLGRRVRVVVEPGTASVLAMTLQRVKAGEWSDIVSVDANYLRRTDAEISVGSSQ